MQQQWQQLTIHLAQSDAIDLSEWLEDYALSVSLSASEDEALYQQEPLETPLWQTVTVQALFSAEDDLSQLIATIRTNYPTAHELSLTRLTDQDWVRLTQSQFPAQSFQDRLWVVPSWIETPAAASASVRLDPGLAFGTGTHETTALCLDWLASLDLTNQRVIDYGCGSGILALAALALGAQSVWAIDHDPQALTATANNAQLNALLPHQQLHIIAPTETDQLPPVPVDLLIANILANPLRALAPTLIQLVNPQHGQIVLSGLLITEIENVLAAYAPHFTLAHSFTRNQWACLVLTQSKLFNKTD